MFLARETNLDDVLQISAVFVNVSKGEQAKAGDLKKAFGKASEDDIIKEVRGSSTSLTHEASISHPCVLN